MRCYRRKRAQGGVIGHNDDSLTGEVITGRIAVIQAVLQAADPYLRFSRRVPPAEEPKTVCETRA